MSSILRALVGAATVVRGPRSRAALGAVGARAAAIRVRRYARSSSTRRRAAPKPKRAAEGVGRVGGRDQEDAGPMNTMIARLPEDAGGDDARRARQADQGDPGQAGGVPEAQRRDQRRGGQAAGPRCCSRSSTRSSSRSRTSAWRADSTRSSTSDRTRRSSRSNKNLNLSDRVIARLRVLGAPAVAPKSAAPRSAVPTPGAAKPSGLAGERAGGHRPPRDAAVKPDTNPTKKPDATAPGE